MVGTPRNVPHQLSRVTTAAMLYGEKICAKEHAKLLEGNYLVTSLHKGKYQGASQECVRGGHLVDSLLLR